MWYLPHARKSPRGFLNVNSPALPSPISSSLMVAFATMLSMAAMPGCHRAMLRAKLRLDPGNTTEYSPSESSMVVLVADWPAFSAVTLRLSNFGAPSGAEMSATVICTWYGLSALFSSTIRGGVGLVSCTTCVGLVSAVFTAHCGRCNFPCRASWNKSSNSSICRNATKVAWRLFLQSWSVVSMTSDSIGTPSLNASISSFFDKWVTPNVRLSSKYLYKPHSGQSGEMLNDHRVKRAISWKTIRMRARSSARNRPITCCTWTNSSMLASSSPLSCAAAMHAPTTTCMMCNVRMGMCRSFNGLKATSKFALGSASKIEPNCLKRTPSNAHHKSSASSASSALFLACAPLFPNFFFDDGVTGSGASSAASSPPLPAGPTEASSNSNNSMSGGTISKMVLSAVGVSVSLCPTCMAMAVLASRPGSRAPCAAHQTSARSPPNTLMISTTW
mmetsp:Transcript_107947/g.302370  ORF Transcript_107947/g.302370 Transcript_107947/m.302370 type:complete len:446 (-) Transcript_107947:376-1713(-)